MRMQAISNENYEIDNEKWLLLNEIHHTYRVMKGIHGIMRMKSCQPYMRFFIKNIGILHIVLQATALVLS
jgi:hypothetical protein